MNSYKKSVFFIVIFRGSVRGSFPSTDNPLDHPVLGLCWGHLVTWAKKQTESRNVENFLTAHNYKLCGKAGSQVPVSNSLGASRFQNSAVRIPSSRFSYPPPLEKFTRRVLPLPLLPRINWEVFPKPLFAYMPVLSPRPSFSLVGKGGSGGILPLFAPGGLR